VALTAACSRLPALQVNNRRMIERNYLFDPRREMGNRR
jgi:hypothetical protein